MTATAPDQHLSDRDYRRLSELIYRVAGIHLPPAKQTMVEMRLRKRLRDLELESLAGYCEYVLGVGQDAEMPHLLDAITTNKTDFYRESGHFDYLTRVALPSLAAGLDRPLVLWSAGCSSGQEPYSLAMVLSEYGEEQARGYRFSVLATDISVRMLERARRAVYDLEAIAPIPAEVRRKYLLRSRDAGSLVVRIAPEIRGRVEFRRLNLMSEDFGLPPVDVIFCRNVVIYFDKATQERLITRLAGNLRPGGYLFMGHSETLHGFDVPLAPVGPTIYRKTAASL